MDRHLVAEVYLNLNYAKLVFLTPPQFSSEDIFQLLLKPFSETVLLDVEESFVFLTLVHRLDGLTKILVVQVFSLVVEGLDDVVFFPSPGDEPLPNVFLQPLQ